MKYRVSRRAQHDLHSTWDYIARDSIAAADRMDESFWNAFQDVAEQPLAGHIREDVSNSAYRFWNLQKYVIAYRIRGRFVIIVRVLHGARDFTRLFRERRKP